MAALPSHAVRLFRRLRYVRTFCEQSPNQGLLHSSFPLGSNNARKEFSHKSRDPLQRRCSLCHAPARCLYLSGDLEASRSGADEHKDWLFSADFKPDIDLEYLSRNSEAVAQSISRRKGNVDVNEVISKLQHLKQLQAEVFSLQERMTSEEQDSDELEDLLERKRMQLEEAENDLYQTAVALPNTTHPDVPCDEDAEPVLMEEVNEKRSFDFPIKGHVELGENLDIIRLKNLGHITGHRSYFLKGAGAMLEDALTRFTLDRLSKRHGFMVLNVPDIIKPVAFEGCGMRTKGLHTQVYRLSPDHHDTDMCLAGTAEVGIAGFFMNKTLSLEDLPMRVAAKSRCYRAETAHSADARGLYRVHQFTKVEMFCVAANETGQESEQIFSEFAGIQKDIFKDLGLHFQVLDMPAHDLGAPAFRKFDMEAWMPHRKAYGEVSSTSNCTDFQSRRLNIRYTPSQGHQPKYVHTLNGTACAVPRMIIANLETFQQRDGSITIPEPLQPYMDGLKEITRPASGRLHFTRL